MKKPGTPMPLNRSETAVSKGSKGSKASALLTSGQLNLNTSSFYFLKGFLMREMSRVRGIRHNKDDTQNHACKSLEISATRFHCNLSGYPVFRNYFPLYVLMPNNSMFVKGIRSHLKIQSLEAKDEQWL